MNSEFIDYFYLLQIHICADDDMIKTAYRRLCKKYHPDNTGSHTAMNLINEAYAMLSDKEQKKLYMERWIKQYSDPCILNNGCESEGMYNFSFQPLRHIVLEYMYFIKNKEFGNAYEMLSEYNKKQLFENDYIVWQGLVSEIHCIVEFDCTLSHIYATYETENRFLRNKSIIEFRVKVIEENRLFERVEEEFFLRKIIFEKNEWRILLNDIDIKKIIRKYKKLIISHNRNIKKNKKYLNQTDDRIKTGLLIKSVFISFCEFEQFRYLRYKNIYSLLGLEFSFKNKEKKWDKVQREEVIHVVGKHLRNLDSYCYINHNTLVVLLPETKGDRAEAVSHKITFRIKEHFKQKYKIDIKIKTRVTYASEKFVGIKEMIGQVVYIKR